MNIVYFSSAAALRAWFEAHHDQAQELWIGFYKKGADTPSVTYKESVDEALCFGWIDGIRKSVDDTRYTNRFTPRKPRSVWSAVNIKRAHELIEMGRMHPAGRNAFEARTDDRSNQYSFENKDRQLNPEYEAQFQANPAAWAFFQAQPPGYRHTASWWVISAKQEATRLKRLATLIEDSANGRRIQQLARPGKKD